MSAAAADDARRAIQAGQWPRAWPLLEAAWEEDPGSPALAQLAAMAGSGSGRPDRALPYLAGALARHPLEPSLHVCLANLHAAAGRWQAGEAALRRALELDPGHAEARENLTILLLDLHRPGEALPLAQALGAAQPASARVRVLEGSALADLGRTTEALEAFEAALARDPAATHAWVELGRARCALGLIPEALEACRRAGETAPGTREPWSNALFALQSAEPDGTALGEAHRAFGRWLESLHAPLPPLPPRPKAPLRVAFLSADFRHHSCAYFLEPLLASLDRARLEPLVLSDVRSPDATTARLRGRVEGWHDTAGLADAALAHRVRELGVDVLMDCMGHTGGNRLPVFALRPAPLALTWLGYPSTTGLSRIDARLTDVIADPPGRAEAHHSEALAYLGPPFLCYQPPPDAPAPARVPGRPLTFGSFNSLAKTGEATLRLWSRLLDAVPESRLRLKARPLGDPGVQALLRARFAACGGDAARLDLAGPLPDAAAHLAAYGDVDVALDPFPYHGTTTTCEALWMGVPVVSLEGQRHASRVGASLLRAVGLPELIARDEAGYLRIAAGLARDADRLAALRAELRPRMAASALCDGPRFARAFEATVEELWRKACARAESEP